MTDLGEYDAQDLERVTRELTDYLWNQRDYFNSEPISTEEWTETTLDFFAARARTTDLVDARPPRRLDVSKRAQHLPREGWIDSDPKLKKIAPQVRHTYGEFIFDLCHSTYPKYGALKVGSYWEESLAAPRELLLILESEFAKPYAGAGGISAIMNDASKLLHVSARSKIVVFASSTKSGKDCEKIIEVATRMVRSDCTKDSRGKRPSWLWVDIPWARWDEKTRPRYWALRCNGRRT